MKKLKAPIGADGANIGTKLFPLDADGNVTVPDDAAQTLVGVGGFEILIDIPEAPEGFTILQSTIGAQSCSFGNESYSTDENGYVSVPTSMVADLMSHGFVVPRVTEAVAVAEPAASEPHSGSQSAPVELPQIPLGNPVEPIAPASGEAVAQPAASE